MYCSSLLVTSFKSVTFSGKAICIVHIMCTKQVGSGACPTPMKHFEIHSGSTLDHHGKVQVQYVYLLDFRVSSMPYLEALYM